jgi:hypothetical protein
VTGLTLMPEAGVGPGSLPAYLGRQHIKLAAHGFRNQRSKPTQQRPVSWNAAAACSRRTRNHQASDGLA